MTIQLETRVAGLEVHHVVLIRFKVSTWFVALVILPVSHLLNPSKYVVAGQGSDDGGRTEIYFAIYV